MVKEGTSEFIGQLGGAAADAYLLGAYQCVFLCYHFTVSSQQCYDVGIYLHFMAEETVSQLFK